jgi:hypothetical protein
MDLLDGCPKSGRNLYDPEVHAEVRRGCGCLLNVLEQQVHLTSECKVTDRSPLVAEVSRSHLA